MKKLFLILSLIISLNIVLSQPPNENPLNYTLVFEDEFDTLCNYYGYHTNIDITKWASIDWNRHCTSPAFRQRYFQNAIIETTGTGKVILKIRYENTIAHIIPCAINTETIIVD